MYIDSRISHLQCEAMEYIYRGLVQDIKESCRIIVLVIEDPHGYVLWIAKVKKHW
jgi:hypothetical protein